MRAYPAWPVRESAAGNAELPAEGEVVALDGGVEVRTPEGSLARRPASLPAARRTRRAAPVAEPHPQRAGPRRLLERVVRLLVVRLQAKSPAFQSRRARRPRSRRPSNRRHVEAAAVRLEAQARPRAGCRPPRDDLDHSGERIRAVQAARRAAHHLHAPESSGRALPKSKAPPGLLTATPSTRIRAKRDSPPRTKAEPWAPTPPVRAVATPGGPAAGDRREAARSAMRSLSRTAPHAQRGLRRLPPRGRHHDLLAHRGGGEGEVERRPARAHATRGWRARTNPGSRRRACTPRRQAAHPVAAVGTGDDRAAAPGAAKVRARCREEPGLRACEESGERGRPGRGRRTRQARRKRGRHDASSPPCGGRSRAR